MGFKDADWAYGRELPTAQKVILAAIAHVTDDRSHQTYVSQKTLAGMVGMSVATVNASVRALDVAGILSRKRRAGVGGYRTTDVITLNTSYVGQANVGEANVGDTYIGETGSLLQTDAPPTSTSLIAEEINQIDQPEGQPDNFATDLESTDVTYWEGRGFDDFWATWPRSEGKAAAAKAWLKAIKKIDAKVIVDYAIAYANSPYRPPKQFVPHASSWLNGERWTDPLPEAPEADRSKPSPTDRARAILALVPEPLKEIS